MSKSKGMTLANAYVQIMPSAEGIKERIEELVGKEIEESGESSGHRFASGFGKVAPVIGKAALAAIGAAATGVIALTKQAVDSYADYEQLVGGMDTLFKDSSYQIQQYASEAYQTAGLSANEYMTTVTSFSAALISSLDGDTAAAAKAANTAIVDMADNANKMGTSMESIQNAYQGFAKQNYTMLDNLALGYGGTKTEMERLLVDAEKLTGIKYDISNLSDVYEAIHVIQMEMGITGTTAEEAASTISGSMSSLKASWQNLLTGIADKDADLSQLVQNVVDSAKTAFGNLLPVIMQSLSSIGQFVKEVAPMIVKELPGLIDTVLPALLEAVTNLLESVFEVLPSLLQTVAGQLPAFINDIVNMLELNAPLLIGAALVMVSTLASGIGDSLPTLIPSVINIVLSIVQTILDNVDNLIDAALAIITGLTTGLMDALPILIEKAPEIIVSIVDVLIKNLPKILLASYEILFTIVNGILENFPYLVASILRLVLGIVETIVDNLPYMIEMGTEISISILNGLIEAAPSIITYIPVLINEIVKIFSEFDFASLGRNMISGIASGIKNSISSLTSSMRNAVDSALGSTKNRLGIHSPSTVFRDEIGKMLDLGMAEGIEGNSGVIANALNEISDMTANALDTDLSVDITETMSRNTHDISQNWSESNDDQIADKLNQLINLLEKFLPDLANRQITLDSGTVVGLLAPQMDQALGMLSLKAERGVLA